MKICYVVRQDLLRAMQEPRWAMALIGFLACRLRKAFDTIEHLSLRSALPRVAAALKPLMKGEGFMFLTLPGSAQHFAEAQGLAPGTLSRTMAQLVRLAEGQENTLC